MGKALSRLFHHSDDSTSTFGTKFEETWPKGEAASGLNLTDFVKKLLEECKNTDKPNGGNIDLQEFMQKSANFPLEFGTDSCRVKAQPLKRHVEIKRQIASAYPVIHERVLWLYLAFLEHKCKFGNDIELELYPKLTLTDFVQRLLEKRCVAFCGPLDRHVLLTGETGVGGFLEVGSLDQKPPLILNNALSYDEMKLSAFLSVSSYTEFLNDGNRHNFGIIESDKSKIETEGVIVGLIGGRFAKENVMEWQDIVISQEQNTIENGYGLDDETTPNGRKQNYRHIWRKFYEENDLLYTDVVDLKDPRFCKDLSDTHFFDNLIMKKRYTISFDTLLLESEARAAAVDKNAFIHVVGIGLGVWQTSASQEKVFLETFTQRLKVLVAKLPHVAVVHFSWFKMSEWKELKNGGTIACEMHPMGGIKTFLSNRNPADKLSLEGHENLLPIVSWAWDSNALPGNEFWVKLLSSSGDPAAACSTLITELHNPHINSLMINGKNLHIATEAHGVIHISEYAKIFFNKQVIK